MSRRSLNTVGLLLVASVVGGCGSNDAAPATTTSPTTVAVATTAAPTTTVESTTTTAAPTTTTLPPAYQRVNFVDISTLELGSCVEVVLDNVDLSIVSEIEQVWFDADRKVVGTVFDRTDIDLLSYDRVEREGDLASVSWDVCIPEEIDFGLFPEGPFNMTVFYIDESGIIDSDSVSVEIPNPDAELKGDGEVSFEIAEFESSASACGNGCVFINFNLGINWRNAMPRYATWLHEFPEYARSSDRGELSDDGLVRIRVYHTLQFESVEECDLALLGSDLPTAFSLDFGESTETVDVAPFTFDEDFLSRGCE